MPDEARCSVNVTIHPWCLDPARDAAVRAAEDGRAGPLPTLDEAIGMLPKSDSATYQVEHENKGDSMATKRDDQAADYRAEAALEARTSTAGEGLRAVPAASGGAEPVAWLCEWTDHTSLHLSKIYAESDGNGTVVPQPLYLAPPQPRGWLTEEERKWIEHMKGNCVLPYAGMACMEAILARSSPPKVVRPMVAGLGLDGLAAAGEEPKSTAGDNKPWQKAILNDAVGIIVDGGDWGRGNSMDHGKLGAAVIWADKEIDRLSSELKEYARQLAAYELHKRSASMRGGNCFAAPAARGWLTGEEFGVIKRVRDHLFDTRQLEFTDIVTLDALLARSPPEVVLPQEWGNVGRDVVVVKSEVIAALAAAGVPVKEVPRD